MATENQKTQKNPYIRTPASTMHERNASQSSLQQINNHGYKRSTERYNSRGEEQIETSKRTQRRKRRMSQHSRRVAKSSATDDHK